MRLVVSSSLSSVEQIDAEATEVQTDARAGERIRRAWEAIPLVTHDLRSWAKYRLRTLLVALGLVVALPLVFAGAKWIGRPLVGAIGLLLVLPILLQVIGAFIVSHVSSESLSYWTIGSRRMAASRVAVDLSRLAEIQAIAADLQAAAGRIRSTEHGPRPLRIDWQFSDEVSPFEELEALAASTLALGKRDPRIVLGDRADLQALFSAHRGRGPVLWGNLAIEVKGSKGDQVFVYMVPDSVRISRLSDPAELRRFIHLRRERDALSSTVYVEVVDPTVRSEINADDIAG